VVIADSEGNVIYQPPHAQLHISNVKMLFAPKDGAKSSTNRFDELRRTSSLTSVDVGGKEYDLYSQPVRLSSIKSEEWENVKGDWVLCGLAEPRESYKQA